MFLAPPAPCLASLHGLLPAVLDPGVLTSPQCGVHVSPPRPVHLADPPSPLCPQVDSLTAARNACRAGAEPSDAIRVVNAVLTQIDQIKRYHCTRTPLALLPALPAQDASGIVSRHCLLYV